MKRLSAILFFSVVLACTSVSSLLAFESKVGNRTPIFSVATSQGTLANYDRDYYGKHHLVLTFFPAAYTPV